MKRSQWTGPLYTLNSDPWIIHTMLWREQFICTGRRNILTSAILSIIKRLRGWNKYEKRSKMEERIFVWFDSSMGKCESLDKDILVTVSFQCSASKGSWFNSSFYNKGPQLLKTEVHTHKNLYIRSFWWIKHLKDETHAVWSFSQEPVYLNYI